MPQATLSSLPYFRELAAPTLAALNERAKQLDLERDVPIISEGDEAVSMYFLSRGAVRVTRKPSGEVLDVIRAPTLFGEMAIVADTPRLASVATDEPSLIFEIARDDIAELTEKYPKLLETILSFHRERLMRNILRVNPIFAPLADRHRDELARGFVSHAVEAGEVILQEGAPGRGLFVLLRGRCDVSHREHDKDVVVGELSEGDIFGEISLVVFDKACTATVRSKTACVVVLLERELFQQHLMSNEAVRRAVIELALTRLRKTENAISSASKAHLI